MNKHLKIAKLLFPYPFKPEQEPCLEYLTSESYNLWQAQTGFGKTLLSLCATLPFLLDPHHPIQQIIVFVRTKTQIFRFFEDVKKVTDSFLTNQEKIFDVLGINPYLYSRDLINPFFSVPLVSKKDLCVHEQAINEQKIVCRDLACPLYTKSEPPEQLLHSLKKDFFTHPPQSSNNIIATISKTTKGKRCPYYTLFGLLRKADIVVTTQAWLNEPLRDRIEDLFFSNPSRVAIIVDETHNLKSLTIKKVDRAFLQMCMDSKVYGRVAAEVSKAFFDFIQPDINRAFAQPDNITAMQEAITTLIQKNKKTDETTYEQLLALQQFLHEPGQIWFTEKFKQELGHINLTPITARGRFLEASKIILMSGTIYPPQIYALLFQLKNFNIITLRTQERKLLKTVFASEKVSSKLENRTNKLYGFIAKTIWELHGLNTKGHTFVFNPSTDFKEKIYSILTEFDATNMYRIRMEQDSKYNQQLLDDLTHEQNTLVLATLNGSFSEGIEVKDPLTGKSKINLIIITGMPLQPPSLENYLIDSFFLKKYGSKLADFVRNFLPINQILQQTVGRGIRGEEDSCWVVCTDHRVMKYNIWDEYGVVNDINDFGKLKRALKHYFDNVY